MDDLTRRLYHAFSVGPLTSTQQDLRVELDETRSSNGGAASLLSRKIRLSPTGTSSHVLAGHRGSGKSTELYFLQTLLENSEDGKRFFTVFCKADEDIDRNDVDFLDVLVAILRQLAKQLQTRQNIVLKPGYLKDRWQRLNKVLKSEVTLKDAGLETGLATLSLAIKNSPDARMELRKVFEPDAGNWLNATNDIISDAIKELSTKGFSGLAIVVDDLDKISRVRHGDGDCWLAENLFVRRAAQLTGLRCHMVYAMPLELAYSHHEPAIKQSFGGEVHFIPMTKLREHPSKPGQLYQDGINKFREVITRRVNSAQARWNDLFADDAVAQELILLSGGQPTELMTLLCEGLLIGRPITHLAIEKLRGKGRREYQRQLLLEHWDIIERVRKDGEVLRDRHNEQAVRELLESRGILQYRNGTEWYGENPYLQDIARPTPETAKP